MCSKLYSRRDWRGKQEANIDYGLWCPLMGHKTTRPVYGDGGSLEYRREELLKIAHPFQAGIFEEFDGENPDWALKDAVLDPPLSGKAAHRGPLVGQLKRSLQAAG